MADSTGTRTVTGPRVPGVRVRRETVIAADRAEELYPWYEATFAPLREAAAARHVLSLEEFAEEMADPRIDKWVATSEDDGSFLGLSTLARDLEAVPWASPDYYVVRHPEHAARGAIWYLGFTMTPPGGQRAGVFATMLTAMMEAAVEHRVIVAWDMCAANVDSGLNDAIMAQLAAGAGAPSTQVDVQTYYSADFSGGSDS